MSSLNRVFLMGNLTKDPEVRYTPSGRPVCDLRMAINRTYKTSDGETHDETCYVGVVAWGRQAETCGEYLSKGAPIMVEGRLQYDEWEKEGQKFSRLRVVADRVQFLGRPKSGGEVRDGEMPARASAPAAPTQQAEPEPAPPRNDELGDDDNLPF